MPEARDVYFVLSDVADDLWDLHQSTALKNPRVSDQARAMYETLENVYLEPIRRSKIRENTEKYKTITANLATKSKTIDEEIARINKMVDQIKRVAEYAKIFDQVIATAAKIAAM
jgi:hypothetical protein